MTRILPLLTLSLATLGALPAIAADGDSAPVPPAPATVAKAEALTLEATAYFRYSYTIQDAPSQSDDETEPHENAFELMRFYFGARARLNPWLSARFTADVGPESPTKWEQAGSSVEVPGNQRYGLYAKFAWLQADLTKDLSLRFGIIDNPYNDFTDKFWGYRYTFKNIGDEEKLWEGADVGAYLRYMLPNDMGEVTAGLVNGSGYKSFADNDLSKDFWLEAVVAPLKGLGGIAANFKLAGYLVYTIPLEEDPAKRLFLSGFVGYQDDLLTLGYQFLSDDSTPFLSSINTSGIGHAAYLRIDTPWKVGLLGRFAMWDAETHSEWDETAESDPIATKYQVLGGVSYAPASLFQFSASGLATWHSKVDGVNEETEVKFLLSTQFQY